MKYMMFVVADPVAAADADQDADELTIDEWLDHAGERRIVGDRLRPVKSRA